MSGLKAYTDTNRWYPQNNFLRPKLATDSLYVGNATTVTAPFGLELGVFQRSGDTAFFDVIGNSGLAVFNGVTTGGSSEAPTATVAGLGVLFGMSGYGDSGYQAGTLPGLSIFATGTWTDTTEPSTVALGDQVTGNIYEITLGSGTASDGDSFMRTDNGQIMHSDFSANRLYFGSADQAYFDASGKIYLPDGTAAAPSSTFLSETDGGTFRPAADQFGIAAAGVHQATISDGLSNYAFLELAPTDRTLAASSAARQVFIGINNTYTLNATNSSSPAGYDFVSTLIFASNGEPFGSGFLFWAHPIIQNSSGSTRTMGPFFGYVEQVTYQANGGSLTPFVHVGYLGGPTFNRINSGTLAISAFVIEFWSQGPTIGAGATLPSFTHFASGDATNSGTLTNHIGFDSSSMTAGTNRFTARFAAPSISGATITQALSVSYNADNTTSAAGIAYGLSRDTHVWRVAAHTLAVWAGASTDNANVGGVIFDNFADVSVGGAETDIYSHTSAASILGANGEKLVALYAGNFVTVGTELTQLKVYFGGTAIWDSTGLAPATGTTSWTVNVTIIRVSSTVVRYAVQLTTSGASGFVYNTVGELTGLTLSSTNILKITGTSSGVGSGVGDIVGKMAYGSWQPAG